MTVFIGGGAPMAHGKLLAKSSEERTGVANEPHFDQSAVVFPAVSDFASSSKSLGEPAGSAEHLQYPCQVK